MTLDFSEQQVRDLHDVLSQYVDDLHDEVVHTDDRTYRAGLKERLERLRTIDQRLQACMEGDRAHA